jgi:hypothetical protein
MIRRRCVWRSSIVSRLGGWYHSNRHKTREFHDVLDKYLNAKLIGNGMVPVISFYDSMFAWREFVAQRQ